MILWSLVVSGNEATVSERFTELLDAGLDDLTVPLAPTADAGDDDEQARLTHPIGRDKVARSVIVAHNLNSKATLTLGFPVVS